MIRNATITDLGNGKLKVEAKCFVTGELHSIVVKKAEYQKWQSGEHAQNAFPTTSADDREFLISGTSPAGWKKMFPEEE